MLMKEEGMKTTPNKMIHIGQPIQLPDEYVEENQGVCIQTHNNSFLFHFRTRKT